MSEFISVTEMVGVYITKAGGDCYCNLVARRRPGMSDDGGETTLTLRSTNNQINPPGVAHNSPASHHQSPAKLDQTPEMCPGQAGPDCAG